MAESDAKIWQEILNKIKPLQLQGIYCETCGREIQLSENYYIKMRPDKGIDKSDAICVECIYK